jgi:hypothetical protein
MERRQGSRFDARVRARVTRGFGRRWRAGLAAMVLLGSATVVASPGTASALGTLSLSLSGSAASVQAGTPWVMAGTLTNTGPTSVNSVTTIGSTSRGHILTIDLPCQITNVGTNVTGYSILVCPDPAIYPSGVLFGPGVAYTAHVTIDTTGLEGQSITYTGHANSPDVDGGRTPDVSATVDVTDPGPTVSITSPVDGQLLDNVTDTTFSADAVPGVGASINSVDFTVDGSTLLTSDSDAPYETTIPAHSLSDGGHTLTATVTDSEGHSASDTITVTQGVEPTATITSPADGSTLDTQDPTVFSVTATASTDAVVTSVDFSVDGSLVASLDTPSAGSTYQTSIPPNSLPPGPHSLSVQVNDSLGESASDVVTVTQPVLVGPVVTIKPPNGFNPSFFDSPRTFQTITVLQPGDVIQSVVWDVDGTTVPSSPIKPYATIINPVTLGPGTHSLNVTVTSARGVGGDTLVVTVPRATLSLDDATAGDDIVSPLSSQFIPAADPGSDAAWNVPVANTGEGTARSVVLEIAVNDGTNPLTFDLAQMLPTCASATVFGSSPGLRCTLGDIGPGQTRYVSVRVPTNGVAAGTQFVGRAGLDSSNADLPSESTLDATEAFVPAAVLDDSGVQIAVAEVIEIATATSVQTATIVNTTAPVSPTNQVVIKAVTPRTVLTSSLTPPAAGPVSFAAFAVRAAVTTVPKNSVPPPVAISLAAEDGSDPVVCPPPGGCKGLPSRVNGDFSHFNDKGHPIKVTILTFLPGAVKPVPTRGIVGTVGNLYFHGDSGIYQLTGPTGRANCLKNPVTKQYATPCHLGNATFTVVPGGVIAKDTVLFVGGDPRMARR